MVQNDFLGEADRTVILHRALHQSVPSPSQASSRRRVAVPGWFSNTLRSMLGRGDSCASPTHHAEELVPLMEVVGDHHEHQDRVVEGGQAGDLVDGHVGVVYLEGALRSKARRAL